ncbi:hemolymph lipopolysaccharide-binding protein-like isoform X1 [Anabrus simplex]|uniref:hemolymph lipopolysaccharide-binding protein-like isoform X1 n=1 Tax=Anabrus simplex TaxID=316456 RepID=UPI0035A2D12A
MLSSVCLVIAMALLAVECSNGPLCSSDEEIFHFSISSKKNSSLHRILQVDLTKCTAGTPNGSGEISLDVGHGRSLWNNSELIHLSTSVYVREPPVRRGDYELFAGIGYYKLHTTAQLWERAREVCVREGAHLIVINSDAEANVVRSTSQENRHFPVLPIQRIFSLAFTINILKETMLLLQVFPYPNLIIQSGDPESLLVVMIRTSVDSIPRV